MGKFKILISQIYLAVLSIIAIFPIYWMFCAASNKSADIMNGRMIPGMNLVTNLEELSKKINVWKCLWNSVYITAIIVVLCLFFSSLAGYGFQIYRSKKRDMVFGVFLACMMIPGIITMIPFYQMIQSLGLLNTHFTIIVTSFVSIYHIFLFRQATQGFPVELVEAARIDGLSELRIFLEIFFPMMKSTFATGFIILFMNVWNSYMWPRLILMSSDKYTMPLLVANIAEVTATHNPDWGAIALGCSICTLPVLVIFLLLQKAFANGITGSIKG